MTDRPPNPIERKLAAIMFTDIVGYTALMAESEEKGLRARGQHRAALGPLAERYRGQIVDESGDELVLSFPSALDAVNCALAVQAQLRNDPELQLRIGIHLGDVVFEGGRVYGDGVNVASRIRPLAEPGGICVSDEVQHSIQNQENIETRSLGEHKLKNVPRPVHVFAVTGTASPLRPISAVPRRRELRTGAWASVLFAALIVAGLGAWWLKRVGTGVTPIRSVAVLPLENLSGDPEQEYFADGMTEALIGDLAKLGSLSVISRTSVMRYKNSEKSLPEIARELNVAGVVEGTVMRAGDRVRITAQLIDARNDTHLWSDRYDRELSDVLALQSDVARAVAKQVRLKLTPEERASLTASRSVDPRAYDAYLHGLQLVAGPISLVGIWGPPTIEQLERAVDLDPDFAEGHAALAQIRQTLGVVGYELRYRSEFPKAREAARRALELDDRLGGAHAVLGYVRLQYDWDFPGAGQAFERALQLSPSHPYALNGYVWYLLLVEGRTEEALGHSERLLLIAPFDLTFRAERCAHLFVARQYGRSLEEVERLRELYPDFVQLDIANTYFMLGRREDAYRAYIAFLERCGAPCDWHREAMVRGWAEGGWEGAVRAWLAVAETIEGFSPNAVAVGYAMIGETDEAFAWLERAYRERDPAMFAFKSHPLFDPLRSDPRYDDLVRRIGFPES
jgi:TolB-like protein/class 3 adenylate cyclase